jgi:hypothetical protein
MEAAEMPGSLKADQQCAECADRYIKRRFQVEIAHSEQQEITALRGSIPAAGNS